MVCVGFFALTCRRVSECRDFTFCHFSSWAGPHCEGAPGGLRGRCGRCVDSGTYGDIFERWVRCFLQMLPIISPFGRLLKMDIFKYTRAITHDRLAKSFLILYLWLCAVCTALKDNFTQLTFLVTHASLLRICIGSSWPLHLWQIASFLKFRVFQRTRVWTTGDILRWRTSSTPPWSRYPTAWYGYQVRAKPWRGRMLLYLQDASRKSSLWIITPSFWLMS